MTLRILQLNHFLFFSLINPLDLLLGLPQHFYSWLDHMTAFFGHQRRFRLLVFAKHVTIWRKGPWLAVQSASNLEFSGLVLFDLQNEIVA